LLPISLVLAGVSALLAISALFRSRSLSKRAERLAESYWELRYEIGQFKVRLNRLETGAGLREPEPDAEAAAPRPAATTSFVPLSSLKI
jgi:hypothetical protein